MRRYRAHAKHETINVILIFNDSRLGMYWQCVIWGQSTIAASSWLLLMDSFEVTGDCYLFSGTVPILRLAMRDMGTVHDCGVELIIAYGLI